LKEREKIIRQFFSQLQDELICGFEVFEPAGLTFLRDTWTRQDNGGGVTCILQDGEVFEKIGIGFSHIEGASLPPSVSVRREAFAEQPYCAMGVSLVAHPRSPLVPTSHMNVRYFRTVSKQTGKPVWWFGGGYDLTPYYGYREDCMHWHRVARDVCLKHYDESFYEDIKAWCDRYFFIKHRHCARGIGGIFFDDLQTPDFDRVFAFVSDVGRSFADAYFPIVEKRKNKGYTDQQRQFQLYRRGRYVEFNLVYDRGTLFGLESGGRVESILMSLPPLVRFDYGWMNETGSAEEALEKTFLTPQDWANSTFDEQAQ
jgi:coproporphyrinogen III oxidase